MTRRPVITNFDPDGPDTWDRMLRHRGIKEQCQVLSPQVHGPDFTIHFHIPSIFFPWRRMEVGVVSQTGEGFNITPKQFAHVVMSPLLKFDEVKSFLSGKREPPLRTGLYL